MLKTATTKKRFYCVWAFIQYNRNILTALLRESLIQGCNFFVFSFKVCLGSQKGDLWPKCLTMAADCRSKRVQFYLIKTSSRAKGWNVSVENPRNVLIKVSPPPLPPPAPPTITLLQACAVTLSRCRETGDTAEHLLIKMESNTCLTSCHVKSAKS